ncbi:MAG: ImmA/IrrE family metallo-endopeptidase [Dehalococcoidales bacterium]|nr:ImmA/IrrE family metallo-endopeptidase [Dehalococcoidales bacterium]
MHTTGLNDAREAMGQQAEALLDEIGIDRPPVDLRIVGSFQRVRDIQMLAISDAGRLIPDGNDFIIQVNAGHSRGKQNFTVGHEIGHTLIPSYRTRPRIVEDITTGAYDQGREEEYLCDVAASELLMPMRLFRARAAPTGLSLDSVVELARLFHASREAAAIRLVQTNLWPSAVAIWRWAYKPTQQHILGQPTLPGMEWAVPQKELRVRYAVHSSGFGYYLHRHLAAQTDGCLSRCFTEGGVVAGVEQLELRKRLVSLHVVAGAVDFYGEDGPVREVLSLFLSEGLVPSANQRGFDLWANVED